MVDLKQFECDGHQDCLTLVNKDMRAQQGSGIAAGRKMSYAQTHKNEMSHIQIDM